MRKKACVCREAAGGWREDKIWTCLWTEKPWGPGERRAFWGSLGESFLLPLPVSVLTSDKGKAQCQPSLCRPGVSGPYCQPGLDSKILGQRAMLSPLFVPREVRCQHPLIKPFVDCNTLHLSRLRQNSKAVGMFPENPWIWQSALCWWTSASANQWAITLGKTSVLHSSNTFCVMECLLFSLMTWAMVVESCCSWAMLRVNYYCFGIVQLVGS